MSCVWVASIVYKLRDGVCQKCVVIKPVAMDVATGWDGGDSSPPPGSKFWGVFPPPRNPMLIGDFLNFAKIFVFSNISIINWAKSDEKSEFGGRWF